MESALVAVGGLGAGYGFEGDLLGCLLDGFLVGRRQDAELEEGVAHAGFDEAQHERIDGHHTAQIHLDPPVVERVVRVRLPVGGGVAVEDEVGGPRAGAHAADARADEVGVEGSACAVQDGLPLDVERRGTVDVEDGGFRLLAPQAGQRAGEGVQVIEQVEVLPEEVGPDLAPETHVHGVGGQLPVAPVRSGVDDDAVSGDEVALAFLGSGRVPGRSEQSQAEEKERETVGSVVISHGRLLTVSY